MDRRAFVERLLAALALGGILLTAGCKKQDLTPRFGNQDKLWELTVKAEVPEEPLVPNYSKDTPAFYRDASLGKVDPSFTPKTGGG